MIIITIKCEVDPERRSINHLSVMECWGWGLWFKGTRPLLYKITPCLCADGDGGAGWIRSYVCYHSKSVCVRVLNWWWHWWWFWDTLNICILMCIKWRGPPLLKEGGQRYRTVLWFVIVLLYLLCIFIFICVCILYLYHEKRSTTERGRTEIKDCFVSWKSFRQQLVWSENNCVLSICICL